ncbi:MAG: hypothetical protein C0598_05665 [Marinilabiliales bacterium]|nr:MAG: hypothetical protein C0598_05665 [Marinilabiliales bacterium]
MVVIIPGVYYNSIPNQTNAGAVIGISLAIFFRLLIFIWYISIIKKIRRDSKIRKAVYISIGVFLIIFGLIYSDGAFAFLNNKNILYVSFLMFISVFCDLIASILTFVALILSRKI